MTVCSVYFEVVRIAVNFTTGTISYKNREFLRLFYCKNLKHCFILLIWKHSAWRPEFRILGQAKRFFPLLRNLLAPRFKCKYWYAQSTVRSQSTVTWTCSVRRHRMARTRKRVVAGSAYFRQLCYESLVLLLLVIVYWSVGDLRQNDRSPSRMVVNSKKTNRLWEIKVWAIFVLWFAIVRSAALFTKVCFIPVMKRAFTDTALMNIIYHCATLRPWSFCAIGVSEPVSTSLTKKSQPLFLNPPVPATCLQIVAFFVRCITWVAVVWCWETRWLLDMGSPACCTVFRRRKTAPKGFPVPTAKQFNATCEIFNDRSRGFLKFWVSLLVLSRNVADQVIAQENIWSCAILKKQFDYFLCSC